MAEYRAQDVQVGQLGCAQASKGPWHRRGARDEGPRGAGAVRDRAGRGAQREDRSYRDLWLVPGAQRACAGRPDHGTACPRLERKVAEAWVMRVFCSTRTRASTFSKDCRISFVVALEFHAPGDIVTSAIVYAEVVRGLDPNDPVALDENRPFVRAIPICRSTVPRRSQHENPLSAWEASTDLIAAHALATKSCPRHF